MHTEHHRWHSPALDGKPMDLVVYGHAGAKLFVFPTSMGTYREWPDRRMHHVLGDHLRNGWLQMYCLHHVHDESWYQDWKHPGARAWRHVQYDNYVRHEVVPFSYSRNPNDFVIATGASLGAYDAAVFALRNPDVVRRLVGMSGRYDITKLTGGYSDPTVDMVNPTALAAGPLDGARYAALRRMDIILAVGLTDPALDTNRQLSGTLWGRGVGNALREWHGFAHDWPFWERMIRLYVGGHD
jgi:esterase/lipase superfamily enzyme